MESYQADWTEVGIRTDLGLGGMARVAEAVKMSGARELREDDQRRSECGSDTQVAGLCGRGLDAQITQPSRASPILIGMPARRKERGAD